MHFLGTQLLIIYQCKIILKFVFLRNVSNCTPQRNFLSIFDDLFKNITNELDVGLTNYFSSQDLLKLSRDGKMWDGDNDEKEFYLTLFLQAMNDVPEVYFIWDYYFYVLYISTSVWVLHFFSFLHSKYLKWLVKLVILSIFNAKQLKKR